MRVADRAGGEAPVEQRLGIIERRIGEIGPAR